MYSKSNDKFFDELLFDFSFFDESFGNFISILFWVVDGFGVDEFCYLFFFLGTLNIDKGSKPDFTLFIKNFLK